ncbi:hypothetical protein MBLNU230_g0945t1 [Neophaeotheca triangularis]
MSAPLARGLTLPRLAVIFCLIFGFYLFRDAWLPELKQYSRPLAATTSPSVSSPLDTAADGHVPTTNAAEECRNIQGADKVMVVLKTGATELYEKLPTHFVTLFKCTPHFLIFSDLAQNFADTTVFDAIAPVSNHFRENHGDFELYRKLQGYQQSGQDMSLLKGDGGWNLDKWKFLPMMHETFAKSPKHIEWFVYMEADTSVSWTNLLQWLKTMDPNQGYYLGSQNVIGGSHFAHGGSGVVVSRAAAEQLASKRETEGPKQYDNRWEEITSTSCCGDEVVARALVEVGVPLTPAWPLIQGETVSSIDFTWKHWCTPAVTYHHVSPIEIDALWQFQTEWVNQHGWSTPYLHADIFKHFISRHVSVTRKDWNNISKDRKLAKPELATKGDEDFKKLQDYEKAAVESQEACEAACLKKSADDCIQWMYSPGRCHIGKVIRFGKSDEREAEHWTSGWIRERIDKYIEGFQGCPKVRWHG